MSELGRRIVSGIILAAVVLAAVWSGGTAFRLLVALAAILIYHEWSTIVSAARSSFRINAFCWIVVVACALLVATANGSDAAFVAVFGGLVALLWEYFAARRVWIGLGVLYAALPAIALAALRAVPSEGLATILVLFAIVWATDIGAYFAGRSIGGPKLAPRISPSKTWSGAVGGALAGVVAGALVALAFGLRPGVSILAVSLVLSVVSQIGDLFESWVKRRFGVKDSSHLIPGHGGIMDRVDGLAFAASAAYFAAILLGTGVPAHADATASMGGVTAASSAAWSPGTDGKGKREFEERTIWNF